MKKLWVIGAGAVLAAAAFGGPAVATAVASAPQNAQTASHTQVATHHDAPTEAEIDALFDRWNAAVETGDPEQIGRAHV